MFKTNYEGLKKKSGYESSAIAIANLSAAQKKMHNKYDNTNYLKQLQGLHEFHETKAKSIHFRRNLLNRQKIANYQNEIDRIRGVLSQTNMNHITKEHLKKREDELKDMINNIS
jgi:hypothetical protein